jgi:hypothetical protein
MTKSKRDPFEVKLKGITEDEFTEWLCRTITDAQSARGDLDKDISIWWGLYEQARRTRPGMWKGAADLASYIPTEKVDALQARLTQAVMGADKICVVEGWGESAKNAPIVEEFHQWKAEDERLQGYVDGAIHNALIECNGIIEVDEARDTTKRVYPMKCAVHADEHGRPILDTEGQFQPARDESGKLVAHDGNPDTVCLEMQVSEVETLSGGPKYHIVKMEDFLYLPGHAQKIPDCYGFARRIPMRLGDIRRLEQQGYYQNVDDLSDADEGQQNSAAPVQHTIGEDDYAEKELWRVHLRYDVDGDGIDEWVIATLSLQHRVLLRLCYDEVGQVRFISIVPFPRPNSVYGYSFVGNKLWTIADEHTARRNMIADRSALATNAPILKTTTSEWDETDQPFGIGAIIEDVDLNQIKQFQVADVPQSAVMLLNESLESSERVSGLNDTAMSGIAPQASSTATAVRAVSHASQVRVDRPLKFVQEGIEDLYQLRHVLYKRQLQSQEQGIDPPDRILKGLERRGIEMPNEGPFRFTSKHLEGGFKFKPRGSTENADPIGMRNTIASFINALGMLLKMSPAFAQMFAANPKAAQSLLEWMLHSYGVPDRQVFYMQPAVPQALPAGDPNAAPTPEPAMGEMPAGLAAMMPELTAAVGVEGAM